MSLEELKKGGYVMDERQWLRVRTRIIMLLELFLRSFIIYSASCSWRVLLVFRAWLLPRCDT